MIPVLGWLVIGVLGLFTIPVIKKVVDKFGDTPAKQLAEQGVSQNKIYDDALSFRNENQVYLKELNKKNEEKIIELEKEINKLDESILSLSEQVGKESDPAKKSQLVAQLNAVKEQKAGKVAQVRELQAQNKQREEKITATFNSLGDPMNMSRADYTAKANNFSWNSAKNWGIIALLVFGVIIVLGFIKKLLDYVMKTVKN